MFEKNPNILKNLKPYLINSKAIELNQKNLNWISEKGNVKNNATMSNEKNYLKTQMHN